MPNPFFSIILPTYNRAKFIPKAIESIVNQHFTDWELIIIDDGSTDNTAEIVSLYQLDRIKYHYQENQERCLSRNNGIKLAKGKYICFLDSDDSFRPNHLSVLFNRIELEAEPVKVFFTNAYNQYENEIKEKREVPILLDRAVFSYLLNYTFSFGRTAIHRSIFDDFLLDKNVTICEDLDFFLRVATKYKFVHVQDYTVIYFLHSESFTLGDKLKPFKELHSYKIIFSKPELKGKLTLSDKFRLISMCYYNMAIYYKQEQRIVEMYRSIIQSFLLCPKGYNGKTNKTLLVMLIYSLPLIGKQIQKLKNKNNV